MEERGLEQIAVLSIDIVIAPGLSSAHKQMTKAEPRQRVIMEGYDWALMSGLRSDPVAGDDTDSPERRDTENISEDADTGEFASSTQRSEEDSSASLEEYLAVRGKQDSKSHSSETTSIYLRNNDDDSEVTVRGRAANDSSLREFGGESDSSITSKDTERGWREKYQEWKTRQVSPTVPGIELVGRV